jgi:hypothetical protein
MESNLMRTQVQLLLFAIIVLSRNAAAEEPKPQPVRTLI